ncbi:hypothetical protein [Roseovarius pacificus]|uniref:hypothetical protein n=1 Tax=Roseovarius pacificus TaxID=337701 RepID=UPI002A18CF5F|nr:hypothetical protein [Roseovarius pacificus]
MSRKPDGPTARLEAAHDALRLALPVMRADLRCMAETSCRSDIGPVNEHTPPLPHTMDRQMLAIAESCLSAIRAAQAQVALPPDDQPAWLDSIIAGTIPL